MQELYNIGLSGRPSSDNQGRFPGNWELTEYHPSDSAEACIYNSNGRNRTG